MISDSAALVMFAIRSSIKLGTQMRRAYIDSTQRRELVLPLPNFFSEPDMTSAANFFAGTGKTYVSQSPRLANLLKKRRTPGKNLTAKEKAEVLDFHTEYFNLKKAEEGGLGRTADGETLSGQEFNALITIRQWQKGTDPNPSTLQRIAGSFIEIGIDYFATVPGALNKDSRQGKVVAGFLDAMSEINFSDEQLKGIPGRLLVAALETVSGNADLLSGDDKVQELVKVATKSLSIDVAKRLKTIGDTDLVQAERVTDWADLVFRSVLSSAGGLVLQNPNRFLGVDKKGEAALISTVGESVLGLVLDEDKARLDRLFSLQGLEVVTKSALTVVGEHPEILIQSGNAGLKKLLGAVAKELGQFDTLLTPDVFPELTRLILEKTGENLAVLWPDLADNPQKHLLLTAASTTLSILTKKPTAGAKWKPRLSSGDVLSVADVVLGELASNPTWLLDEAGELNENLQVILETSLTVLRKRADNRLSPATAVEVLRTVVLKVGTRVEFLDKLPPDIAPAGQRLITAALDAFFAGIFNKNLDARATWQVVRSEAMVTLVNIGLNQLSKVRLSPEKLKVFQVLVQQRIEALAAGEPLNFQTFEARLQEALAA